MDQKFLINWFNNFNIPTKMTTNSLKFSDI